MVTTTGLDLDDRPGEEPKECTDDESSGGGGFLHAFRTPQSRYFVYRFASCDRRALVERLEPLEVLVLQLVERGDRVE